jgi:3-deoxy-D-manno-octulosonic-acid transferase
MTHLMHGLYAGVLRLATPAYLWRVWSRGRVEPDYRARWWERLGVYGASYRAQVKASQQRVGPLIWVHAVSLGEARAASALIQALREQCPTMRLLLTHSTATGRAAGQALVDAGRGDLQTWLPYDTPGAVRRFLALHQPAVGVLMETEVWPVLQHEAPRAGVPMVLANARLSDKSLRQGQRLSALMQPAVRTLSLVLPQTQDDARRLLAMIEPEGLPAGQRPDVQVCGNVKFDMTPSPTLLALGRQWREAAWSAPNPRPVVLAASTREGEEPGLLAAWRTSMKASGDGSPAAPRLCIVPRHPQRFDEVAAMVQAAGLTLSRRSQWPSGQPDAQALRADVWLGDSMGEMPAYFALAQAALLGGSFAPLGGQNLIEAAACGCPLVMGPSTFNFLEAAELSEQAGAASRVKDWAEGVTLARNWVAAGDQSAHVNRCLAFAHAHRGAASRMAQQILTLVPPSVMGLI